MSEKLSSENPVRPLLPTQIIGSDGSFVETVIRVDNSTKFSSNEVKCPICLGTLNETWTVMACLHRFCSDCIHHSLRMELGALAQKECPLCRTKLASRRSSRADYAYDAFVKMLTSHNKQLESGTYAAITSNYYTDGRASTWKYDNNQNIVHEKSSNNRINLDDYRRAHDDKIKLFRAKQQEIKKRNRQSDSNSNTFRVPDPIHIPTAAKKQKCIESDTITCCFFPLPQSDPSSSLSHSNISSLKKPYLTVSHEMTLEDLISYLSHRSQYLEHFIKDDDIDLYLHINNKNILVNDHSMKLKDIISKYITLHENQPLFFYYHCKPST